jgi:hypothetical protein
VTKPHELAEVGGPSRRRRTGVCRRRENCKSKNEMKDSGRRRAHGVRFSGVRLALAIPGGVGVTVPVVAGLLYGGMRLLTFVVAGVVLDPAAGRDRGTGRGSGRPAISTRQMGLNRDELPACLMRESRPQVSRSARCSATGV